MKNLLWTPIAVIIVAAAIFSTHKFNDEPENYQRRKIYVKEYLSVCSEGEQSDQIEINIAFNDR